MCVCTSEVSAALQEGGPLRLRTKSRGRAKEPKKRLHINQFKSLNMVTLVPRKRGSMLSAAVVITAFVLMVTAGAWAYDDYLDKAGQFCDYGAPVSHFGNTDYCGFVVEGDLLRRGSKEYNETIENTGCYGCGTAVGGWPSYPSENGEGVVLWPGGGTGASYGQTWHRFLSLHCTGAVNIEAIYQVIPSEYQDIYGLGGAGLYEKNFTRCSLGTGDSPAPVEEATNCVSCYRADDERAADACPQLNVGEWYQDTVSVFLGDECPPSSAVEADYPIQLKLYADAGMKINVTSFTATQADGYSKPDFGFHPCFVHSGCGTSIEWLDEHDGDGYSPGWYCADGVVSDTCDINPDCITGAGTWICGEENESESALETYQTEAEGK